MCGVMPWCGIVRHGWSAGAGCGNHTSPAYPASWPALERAHDGVAVADLPARRVDEVRATLHPSRSAASSKRCSVSGWSGALIVTTSQTSTSDSTVSWNVTPSSLLDVGGQPVPVGVVERRPRTASAAAAPPSRYGPRRRSRPACPPGRRSARRSRRCSSRPRPPTGTTGCSCGRAPRIIITTCSETLMLLRVGDLGDGDAALDRGLQVDVVGADAGRDRELQVRGLRDSLGGQVRGPERLRDHDVGVGQLALEDGVGAVLVGRDDEAVAAALRGTSAVRARRRRCRAARRA